MKVVFLKNLNTGIKKGQVKNVADGYAKNYLFVNKIAAPYAKSLEDQLKREIEKNEKIAGANSKRFSEIVDTLNAKRIIISAKASEDGTLYAGIGKKEVAKQVQKTYKVPLSVQQIVLEKPIKNLGVHEIDIQLTKGTEFKMSLTIQKE